jgi:hypothetical protein
VEEAFMVPVPRGYPELAGWTGNGFLLLLYVLVDVIYTDPRWIYVILDIKYMVAMWPHSAAYMLGSLWSAILLKTAVSSPISQQLLIGDPSRWTM